MIVISIFILFVLYTLACIADGPDIKPILKVKIGTYLRIEADKLTKVRYCNPDCCILVNRNIRRYNESTFCDITMISCNTELLRHTCKVDEETAYYYKTGKSGINIIDELKRICSNSIIAEVQRRIKYDIDDDNPDCCIYVTGSIVVEKNDRRHKKS